LDDNDPSIRRGKQLYQDGCDCNQGREKTRLSGENGKPANKPLSRIRSFASDFPKVVKEAKSGEQIYSGVPRN
jgi:hypothetical protein